MTSFLKNGVRLITELKYREKFLDHKEEDGKKILAKVLNEALAAVKKRKYTVPFKLPPRRIIALGVAVYGRDMVQVGFVEQSELNMIHKPEINKVRKTPKAP
jgi:hypothetical protein